MIYLYLFINFLIFVGLCVAFKKRWLGKPPVTEDLFSMFIFTIGLGLPALICGSVFFGLHSAIEKLSKYLSK